MRREERSTIYIRLTACLLLLMTAASLAETLFQPANITSISHQQSFPQQLGSTPADTDKTHYGTGGWFENWYQDLNANGSHDPGEPFSDTQQSPDWITGPDNSCWLASACNMLEQIGVITNAYDLYIDYSLNGVPDGSGNILTWDDGGLQEYAIQSWIDLNPVESAGLTMEVHWRSFEVQYSNGVYAWQDFNPRSNVANYLDTGWEVGIGMWPLVTDGFGGFWHEGGHALTIQAINLDSTFDCTDSDRDGDWLSAGDLNTYIDRNAGPTPFEGHNYYGWYNDFYDGDITVYPAGDVGYICAVIPEPATLFLAFSGASVLFLRRCR